MKTLCTLVSAVLTPVAVAQPDFSAVDRAVEALLEREERLPGAAVLVADREGVLHEAYFGGYDRETVVPIASASKIVAATAVMTLVDDGRMALDAPVSTYLPGVFDEETAGPEKAALTIDELFSMTSGLPADGRPARFVNDRGASMRDAVLGIAREIELEGEPGGGFRYGSYGMHVAGHAAETVSGKDFESLVTESVCTPLGITTIEWDAFGETENYWPAANAEASLPDYARFMRMLLRRGELDGTRVLSEAAVESMFEDRTADQRRARAEAGESAGGWGYAFGMWVEQRDDDGNSTRVSSPGLFGFTPVLDLEDDYVAVFMVTGLRNRIAGDIREILGAIDDAMAEARD